MSISISIKKEISQDWLNAFPELSSYKASKLYKVVGPFILGIELFTLPYTGEKYRPYFVGYSLWGSDDDCPLFLQEIKNKKGLQFNIPYLDYASKNQEAIECARNQLKASFDIVIQIKDLLQVIDNLLVTAYSFLDRVSVNVAKFYFALYIGDFNLVNETLKEIVNEISSKDPYYYEFRFGTREHLIERLQNDIINREAFLNRIELNLGNKNFKKLKIGDLVD